MFLYYLFLLLFVIICITIVFAFIFRVIAKEKEHFENLFNPTKQAAENGDIKSMYLLSSFYEKGIGVKQDMEKAFYWYKIAAEKQYIEYDEELEKSLTDNSYK
jgi:uncharacterized membrane protein